ISTASPLVFPFRLFTFAAGGPSGFSRAGAIVRLDKGTSKPPTKTQMETLYANLKVEIQHLIEALQNRNKAIA
ncbi:MAG: hypothetical protein AAF361_15775, partial [Bacteroidota bacterium]